MYPGRPEVEAVAVLDGKVLSTGSIDSMQPWLSHYGVTVGREDLQEHCEANQTRRTIREKLRE